MTIKPDITAGDDLSRPELRDLLKAYQTAIDVNIISSITDTSGIITHVNKKFCEVSKYSWHELVGQNHRIINSEFHSREFFADMWNTIRRGEVWQGEIMNKAKDGTFYWVETVIIPIRDEKDKVYRFLSLRQLITDKKNIEAERAEYLRRLRQMLDITSHGLRAPLATCMGILNMLDEEKLPEGVEEHDLMQHVRDSARRLDEFSRELTRLLNNLQEEFRHVIPQENSRDETT